MIKRRHETVVPRSNATEHKKAVVLKWLANEARLFGAVDSFPELGNCQYLSVGISYSGIITGRLFMLNDRPAACVDHFEVSNKFTGNGIGGRLIKSFMLASTKYGAETLWSDGVSNQALGLRAKLFGAQALKFYDAENPEFGFLPLSVSQAQQTNDRINTLDELDPDRREPDGHIGIAMDLTALDMHDWPQADTVVLR